MTKKVLISLEDISDLRTHTLTKNFPGCIGDREPTNAPYGVALFEVEVKKWFDAQPDIGLMNINELIGHKERVLSKMETTGGEDDN